MFPSSRLSSSVAASAALLLLASQTLPAATYVVPADGDMVHRADAIIIGSALSSYAQEDERGGIETVTLMSIEEVIKGSPSASTIEIHEPGGRLGKKARIIPGAPMFREGERVLLFLRETQPGRWMTADFALGKFSFLTDEAGQKLLVRQENDITGWDPDLRQHQEGRRSAENFLDFVRAEARGETGNSDYKVVKHELNASSSARTPRSNAASTSPKSYTPADPVTSNVNGFRWNAFPSAVTYKTFNTSVNTTAAVNAVNAAFAAWNGDSGSNVNLVNGGAEAGPAKGLTEDDGNGDGKNTVRFEIDLHAIVGADSFVCNAHSYSGLFGLGGITLANTSHTGPAGETFWTITEADVDMNKGVLGCAYLINTTTDLNTAVAHEVGHSIGFRHSDFNRDNTTACTPSATNECSSSAIMKGFIPAGINAALQTWDTNAVRALYPSSVVVPPGAASITATATSTTSVSVAWSAVATATAYDVYRQSAGGGFIVVGLNIGTAGYTDNSVTSGNAYLYKVVAKNAGGSGPDSNKELATTVAFSDDPLVATSTVIKADHLTQLRTAVNAVRLLAGVGTFSFTDASPGGVNVKSVHVTQLRTNLDAALTALGLATSAYTNPASTGTLVRAVDFQEIRTRVK
jgi:hypothetical protein